MINDPEYIDKIVGKIKEIPAKEIIAAAKKVDLEDAIQTVKDFLETCNEDLNGEISIKADGIIRNAIEEVLRAHNELQEEFFWQQIRIRNEYVPISMVKDKIDEYAKKRKELADGNFFADQSYINNDTALVIGMSVLEDLIKERKKQNEL